MKNLKPYIALIFITLSSIPSNGQGIDSTQIGKEYPYILPILGQKSYERGYKLPKPFGIMPVGIFTKQNIVLENFEIDFTAPDIDPDDYWDASDILSFGPSTIKVLTANMRLDMWILPFLSVGGYYGSYTGKTNISFQLPGTDPISVTSDNNGAYWGFNVVAVAPLGPVNLSADYSWSWSQNNLLNKPVLVNVAGLRLIKNWNVGKKPDMFVGAWAGVQFQFMDAKTDGKISLKDITDGGTQARLDEWYNGIENPNDFHDRFYNEFSETLDEIGNTTIHYRFDKRLEKNWNFIIGGQWQINREWQLRTEAGFLPGKYQVMLSANYRFGL